MRLVQRVDEADVVAAFLRAELDSSRYGPKLRSALQRDRVDAGMISTPDLADPQANTCRRALLAEHRGWGRGRGMFEGSRRSVLWYRAAPTRDELEEIL